MIASLIMFLLGMATMFLIVMIIGEAGAGTGNKKIKDAIKDIELVGSIKYRFAQVTEITSRQMDLISSVDRPSASAAHSRHKNSIAGELKALEQQKIDIFKSILADGVDPQLSIVVDGQPKQ